ETARRQYEQIAQPGNLEDLFALVDTPVASDLRRQLNEKSAELTRTGGTLGERHPMIVSLRLELGKLQAQMSAEVERVRQVRQADLAMAEREASSLSDRVDGLK